jgi:prevent-host-death family protein
MSTIPVTEAEAKLAELIGMAAESHEPIQIVAPDSTGVLVSEADWRSIQETLYLLSIAGMRESIREGMDEPVERCAKEPGW